MLPSLDGALTMVVVLSLVTFVISRVKRATNMTRKKAYTAAVRRIGGVKRRVRNFKLS